MKQISRGAQASAFYRAIEKITEAMVEVQGEGMRDLTWVTIQEVKKGDWAIGGRFPKPKPQSP